MQTSIPKNSFSDMITCHLDMENCVLVINFIHEQSFMGLVYVICLHVCEKEFIHNFMNCFWTHCYMPLLFTFPLSYSFLYFFPLLVTTSFHFLLLHSSQPFSLHPFTHPLTPWHHPHHLPQKNLKVAPSMFPYVPICFQ